MSIESEKLKAYVKRIEELEEDLLESRRLYKDAKAKIDRLENPWISVEERLPKNEDLLLICGRGLDRAYTGFYYMGHFHDTEDSDIVTGIDFWMPLPEKPHNKRKWSAEDIKKNEA